MPACLHQIALRGAQTPGSMTQGGLNAISRFRGPPGSRSNAPESYAHSDRHCDWEVTVP